MMKALIDSIHLLSVSNNLISNQIIPSMIIITKLPSIEITFGHYISIGFHLSKNRNEKFLLQSKHLVQVYFTDKIVQEDYMKRKNLPQKKEYNSKMLGRLWMVGDLSSFI